MRKGYIYIIKNKINEKVYIGQTLLSVEERFKQHTKPSNSKKHYKIYKAMNKYGVENFYYEILESDVSEEDINEREIFWIEKYDSFKNGYNSNPGGYGRTIYKDIDIKYIINNLKNGKSIKDIAIEMNVCKETIKRILNRNGIYNISKIQDRKKLYHNVQVKIDRDKIKQLYDEGKDVKEISIIMKCNVRTVRRIMKELNIPMKFPRYDYSNIDADEIIKDKLNGEKVKYILKKYNISYGYYFKIWKEYRINNNI